MRRNVAAGIAWALGLGAVAAVGVGVVVLVLLFSAISFDGCDIGGDFNLNFPGETHLGVAVAGDGSIHVLDDCRSYGYMSITVAIESESAADPEIVWRVKAPQLHDPDEVVIGRRPQGFTEEMRLAQPLETATRYRVIYRTFDFAGPTSSTAPTTAQAGPTSAPTSSGITPSPSSTTDTPLGVGGGTETFRPADLKRGQVWTGSRLMSRAAYRALVCKE